MAHHLFKAFDLISFLNAFPLLGHCCELDIAKGILWGVPWCEVELSHVVAASNTAILCLGGHIDAVVCLQDVEFALELDW